MRGRCLKRRRIAGKFNKMAKMIVRTVAFEGLQPLVAEAFARETENIQRRKTSSVD